MLSDARSVGAFFRRCAFLFLALSVFGFGFRARLQAYTTSTSNLTASKMSTEKHSAKVLKAFEEQDIPADETDAQLIMFLSCQPPYIASQPPVGQVAKIELADPRRLDLGGVYSLHGPPATTL